MSDHTLLGTDNVNIWAEEFCRIFNGKMIRPTDINTLDEVTEGTMITWFANAMEVAKDRALDRLIDELPYVITNRMRTRYLLENLEQEKATYLVKVDEGVYRVQDMEDDGDMG